jgi:hypothetical protein
VTPRSCARLGAHLPSALLRLAGLLVVGLSVTAVLLGRYAAVSRAPSPPRSRTPAHPRYTELRGNLFVREPRMPRLLDTESGQVTPFVIPGVDEVKLLGCSPWRDEAGQYRLFILWKEADGTRSRRIIRAMGMAQCTYPGGQILGSATLDNVPSGRVCWFPDRSDRILFAAGDGKLYNYTLPDDERLESRETLDRPIRWDTATPGAGRVMTWEPCWPCEPAMGGRLLVALDLQEDAAESFVGPRLWWLQLSPDGAAVVAAGPVINPEGVSTGTIRDEERLPAVGKTRDGPLMLAYLAHESGRSTWDLWMTSLEFGGSDQASRPPASIGRKLAEGCEPIGPAFSADGLWVYAVQREGEGKSRLERFPVTVTDHPPAAHAVANDGGVRIKEKGWAGG